MRSDGAFYGTLCAVDPEPRQLTRQQADLLVVLARLAATQIEREEREAEREATARLEGVTLTARELAHLLFNALVPPVAVVNQARERADLPPDLRERLERARDGLAQAVEHVERLRQVVRVATRETPIGPSLDLERSARHEEEGEEHADGDAAVAVAEEGLPGAGPDGSGSRREWSGGSRHTGQADGRE